MRPALTLLYFLAPAGAGAGYLAAVAVGLLVADIVCDAVSR